MTLDPNTLPYRPCVGVMLANKAGQIFVGERIDTPGAWQMPQGGIDKGEAPRDAALRELWEETGVNPEHVTVQAETTDWLTYDLPDHLLGKVWKGKYRGQKQLWFLLRFNSTDDKISIASEHPEFAQWKWSNPTDLVAEIVPFKKDIYDAVIQEFAAHL
ncbi:RNA pyrophosphohydrolase [Pacificibacter marinus]|uniref:RNA pyrophosphohydrolase n=1 Tax=Pacificibacter marinus TaxID=658057 RepID=A0A1Y5S1R6_9RHOB|nr:RNA pyrophosphohydrolase [Pacificibacter marinus]SEK93284.1 putative (di)nucleoside polyphosphate hydrolase [Pacificibacter marinus]SLN30489.1 RNA pyrophosphohydrolase [Pacificibacter marinus]